MLGFRVVSCKLSSTLKSMEFHLLKTASKLNRLHLSSVGLPLISVPFSFIAHSICTGSIQEYGMDNLYDISGLGF